MLTLETFCFQNWRTILYILTEHTLSVLMFSNLATLAIPMRDYLENKKTNLDCICFPAPGDAAAPTTAQAEAGDTLPGQVTLQSGQLITLLH